jgi:hypothetical protein
MLALILKATLFMLAIMAATTGYIYYNGGLSPDIWFFRVAPPAIGRVEGFMVLLARL